MDTPATHEYDGGTVRTSEQTEEQFDIAEAARRAGVHEQTLRHYERLGLITPGRKNPRPQSPRVYTAAEIERVTHIRRLMDDLGVNLAGVETILHMRDRMEQMQHAWQDELARIREEYENENARLRGIIMRMRRVDHP